MRSLSVTSDFSERSDASSIPERSPIIGCIGACGTCLSSVARSSIVKMCSAPIQYLSFKIRGGLAKSRFHGWRVGVLFGIVSSTFILCFNIGVLVTTASINGGYKLGFAEPFNYGPTTLSRLSIAIHVLINALGTILLAASNYTMQAIASPTRHDLDKAHKAGRWFDIGILSMRNLKLIPRKCLIICIILGLSPIPLHLFYNSVAIYIASTNSYKVFLIDSASSTRHDLSSNISYDKVANRAWPEFYDTAVVHHGDLYLAIDGFASNVTIDNYNDTSLNIDISWPANVTWPTEFSGSQTLIQNLTVLNITGEWLNLTNVFNYTANYSLPRYAHMVQSFTRNVPRRDRMVFSFNFLIIVIVCNLTKLLTMIFVLVMEKENFTVTLGDCAATYLQTPDPCTTGMCIYSKEALVDSARRRAGDLPLLRHPNKKSESGDPRVWRKQQRPYLTPLHISRSFASYYTTFVIALSLLLCMAVAFDVSRRWGTTSDIILGQFPITSSGTLFLAWLVNTPQLVLSAFYVCINGECTLMAGVHEWNNLTVSRKGLRVTDPIGEQRGTYFLQLPYRWSLPLVVVSGGFHWLLSQSLFLVRIDRYDRSGTLLSGQDESRMGCGFSGLSVVVMCGAFWILVFTTQSMSRRTLRVRVPYAAGCSLVISAACHAAESEGEGEVWLEKVQWGVVKERIGRMWEGERHCGLSGREIGKPRVGRKYL